MKISYYGIIIELFFFFSRYHTRIITLKIFASLDEKNNETKN